MGLRNPITERAQDRSPAHAKKTPDSIAAVEWSAIPNDVGEEATQRHSPLFRRSRWYLAHLDPNLDAVRRPGVHEAQGLRLPRLQVLRSDTRRRGEVPIVTYCPWQLSAAREANVSRSSSPRGLSPSPASLLPTRRGQSAV
jgi:hypothetical protein